MNFLSIAYHEVIYRPLFNGLVFLYTTLPLADLGLAIFVLTFFIRVILHPLIEQSVRSQAALTRIQPKLRDIQKRLANDREAQAKATMELYRTEGVHPLSGCIPILIQLPILLGLFKVFRSGVSSQDFSSLYPFITNPTSFHTITLGLFNLAAPSIPLAFLAGLSQYFQGRVMPQSPAPDGEFARAMRFQTTYMLPAIIVAISWRLPAAVAFYWTAMNALAIVQQLIIERRMGYGKREPEGNRDRASRKAEDLGAH